MGILEDLSPYMTLLRFSDQAGIEQAYYKSIYSNILKTAGSGVSPQVYDTSNALGGLFRIGSFGEDFELERLDCYFDPVAGGENWRAVVRGLNGEVIGASEYREISGADEHVFEFDPPVSLVGRTRYAFGIEAEDSTQQATAYYNTLPNNMIEGSFRRDEGAVHSFDPPTLTNQAIVFGTGYNGRIRHINHSTGETVVWEVDSGGTGSANDARVHAVTTDDEVVASIGTELKLLDLADGSEIWSYDLGSRPYSGVLRGDLVYLHLANGNLAIADLSAETPPNVESHSLGIKGPYLNGGPMMAVTPDGSAVFVLVNDNGNAVRKYDASGDFTSYEWQHQPQGTPDLYVVGANDESVFAGGISGFLVQVDVADGDFIQEHEHADLGSQILGMAVSENGYVYVVENTGDCFELYVGEGDEEDGSWRVFNPWSGDASRHPHTIAIDGESIYLGSEEDQHRVARVDRLTLETLWETADFDSTANTYDYSAHIAVRDVDYSETFPELVDEQLALRLHRRIEWYPLSNAGYLRGHRYWRTFVELSAVEEDIRALVPEVRIAQGGQHQFTVQFENEDGEWVDLELARRNPLLSMGSFRIRVILEPADVHENWSVSASSDERSDATDFLTFPSRNRAGWSDTLFNNASNWRTGRDSYGGFFSMTNTSYDSYTYGLMFESRGADGDVEFMHDVQGGTVGNYFYFRAPGKAPASSWRLEFENDELRLEQPNNSTQVLNSAANGRNYWRVIWKGEKLLVLRDGRVHAEFDSLTQDDAEVYNWFGINTYGSNNPGYWEIRGHAMAAGPEDGADGARIDFLSLFHERAS